MDQKFEYMLSNCQCGSKKISHILFKYNTCNWFSNLLLAVCSTYDICTGQTFLNQQPRW